LLNNPFPIQKHTNCVFHSILHFQVWESDLEWNMYKDLNSQCSWFMVLYIRWIFWIFADNFIGQVVWKRTYPLIFFAKSRFGYKETHDLAYENLSKNSENLAKYHWAIKEELKNMREQVFVLSEFVVVAAGFFSKNELTHYFFWVVDSF